MEQVIELHNQTKMQYKDVLKPSSASTLDTNSFGWQSWYNTGVHPLSSANVTAALQPREVNEHEPAVKSEDYLNQLTKHEFRRLTQQLRDVSWNLNNKFRGLGFNRFKSGDDEPSRPGSALYRSQLALNNRTFNESHQSWRPYVHASTDLPTYTRCKPVAHKVAEREKTSRTTLHFNRIRPKSSPISNSRYGSNVSFGDYDMLNAEIISELSTCKINDGDSKFGERLTIRGKDNKGETNRVIVSHAGDDPPDKAEDVSSGIGSASSEDISPDIQEQATLDDTDSDDDGEQADDNLREDADKSDDERIPEPKTPPPESVVKVPEVDWRLKPDALEGSILQDGIRDRSRYDFDATKYKEVKYTFADIFSSGTSRLNLRMLAERDATLEIKPSCDKTEAKILQRCLDMEKLQFQTERQEDNNRNRYKAFGRFRTTTAHLSKSRVQSAKGSRPGSSKCAQDCLQIACVGDCPTKHQDPCVTCHKKQCVCGQLSLTYSVRGQAKDKTKATLQRPKSCGSCSNERVVHTLNANQESLGRPRSSHLTYSHAKKTVTRQSLHMRSQIPHLSDEYSVASGERPSSFGRPKSGYSISRGRNSVSPHKSYSSQRRISLSASSYRPVFGVKRTRSAKAKKLITI